MSANPDSTCSWEQQSMFKGQSTEITLRIGVIPSGDHVQFQVEAMDLGNGELVAMTSMAHATSDRADEIFSRFVDATRDLMHGALDPF